MIVHGLVMTGVISFSKKLQAYELKTDDNFLYTLQAYLHGQFDASPFDQFEKVKCEVVGFFENLKFVVRKASRIDGVEGTWSAGADKQCPQCFVTLFKNCDLCPYCTAEC